ncbi:uncharacterized protein HMPREF1541_02722 [Cyphellophora europaea CBS 101466]|uniref:Anaphase-promoting complex subunit 4 WD40 domain-containing protein n=1 Tax=Cyphellophora europaea (strain CBS 101466) TaxID=1220924 RepID=W2S6A6_CYPE1|nr:uncharacterized protein HMPREF1541_02722 [Cyphellophora europaea CBS 101466]ETN43563.1 hypothetical protein HMPREF1541_02722 [Cyphellophora europaea CBS 101466]
MAESFDAALLRARLGVLQPHRSVKRLCGHPSWIEDLDIVNELGGHSGCVNALSWSSGGTLLASGSDDTNLVLWDYNPTSLAKPFTLNTSVSTGHHANIFSVKFMPHTQDRTVVTCAGDSEVRVFDIESSGSAQSNASASAFATSTRSRRFSDFFPHARWLSETNTNARVYRSHADRAKRIVTESSPHLFLTCSEDGEVRQWDLRLPSSAYPAPRNARGLGRFHRTSDEGSDNVPPPLISYKKYALDLNSISCAASQPHYIALGGAHLHCFLHDRRMLGRDLEMEAGRPASKKPKVGMNEDDAMSSATRCVRRFAPNDKRRMATHDHGHITACKISDARPNEMLVSWSGDYVYSFDLVKSPDARDADAQKDESFQANRLSNRLDRKRKRKQPTASAASATEKGNAPSRLRRVSDHETEDGSTALQVRFENGETEELPLDFQSESVDPEIDEALQESLLNETQRLASSIAHGLTRLRKEIFDFSTMLEAEGAMAMENSSELTPYTSRFTAALGSSSSLLPQMNEVMREWSYPMDPSEDDVVIQNTFRRNRQAAWRFVQASGCLSIVLGGRLQTLSSVPDPRLELFRQIKPAVHEGKHMGRKSRFCYDFLKAILLWIEGGQDAVIKAFIRPTTVPMDSPRFPLAESDNIETSLRKLHEYLTNLADEETPVINLDTNRFEVDENRQIFPSQTAAVQAFSRALAGIELQLRHGQSEFRIDLSTATGTKRIMDKGAAARFWGAKVGRSLLMQAAEDVTYDTCLRAFGGVRVRVAAEESESSLGEIDPDQEERVVEEIDVVRTAPTTQNGAADTGSETSREIPGVPNITVQAGGDTDDEDENMEDVSSNEGESESEDEPMQTLFRRRVAFGRSRERAGVNLSVPYSSHSRVYKGHCNTRTVKDVNYLGLDDEYVVSGSDDGHFFIWDRKTSRIVNILKGDGEVVNVVQGHPYEPMVAVSGIDSTVKIFGAGGESRERDHASKGIDVANPSGSIHSSLRFGGRRRRARQDDDDDDDEDGTPAGAAEDTTAEEAQANGRGLRSRQAMHDSYRIIQSNDEERRSGLSEAYVSVSELENLDMGRIMRMWLLNQFRVG